VGFDKVEAAARLVRKVLGSLGLGSFPKATDGRGLRVVAPLTPRASWSECLDFVRAVSSVIERSDPGLFTAQFAKAGRDSRILLDYRRAMACCSYDVNIS
jgi:bifunctional non-homologous end joining protein LigD